MSSDITSKVEVVKRPRKQLKKRVCKRCSAEFYSKDHPPSWTSLGYYCSRDCSKARMKQVPGKLFSFKCGHSAVLPSELGQANELVRWNVKSGTLRGGNWNCKLCAQVYAQTRNRGEGWRGKITRIMAIVNRINWHAKARGYAQVTASKESILALWEAQNDKCAACEKPIAFVSGTGCNLDHSHVTGEVRGFICRTCNVSEGYLKDYTSGQFDSFCRYWRRYIGKEDNQTRGIRSIHDAGLGSRGNSKSGWAEQRRKSS